MAKQFLRTILRATQSPLNQLQWHVDFDCGHSLWITQKTKPKGRKNCNVCSASDVIHGDPAKFPRTHVLK